MRPLFICAPDSGASDDDTRSRALRASISTFTLDMSLHELQLVDVEVMKIRRRRKGAR